MSFSFRLLFICDANFNYVLDKCRVLNKIIEPAIFIFKINTNIISIHIDIEYRNTFFCSYMYSVNTYETVIKFCMMIFRLYAFLERLYYRLMSSLLALVRYRNSGAFSVEAKLYCPVNFGCISRL